MKMRTVLGAYVAANLLALGGGIMLPSLVSANAQVQSRQVFRLCAGDTRKNYYKAGQEVRKTAMGSSVNVDVQVIPTEGSIDNQTRVLKKECDGLYAQSDSVIQFANNRPEIISAVTRGGSLYNEDVILACNRKSNITEMSDLKPDTSIAVSGGSRITFDQFKSRVKGFKGNAVDLSGEQAIAQITDASSGVQCIFDVAARGSTFIRNDLASVGDQIVLVSTYDEKVAKEAKDPNGRLIYESAELPAGTYPKLQPTGYFGGSKKLQIMQVPALFLVSSEYMRDNKATAESVLRAFRDSKGAILKVITPKN